MNFCKAAAPPNIRIIARLVNLRPNESAIHAINTLFTWIFAGHFLLMTENKPPARRQRRERIMILYLGRCFVKVLSVQGNRI
jgi:hypothetical protein